MGKIHFKKKAIFLISLLCFSLTVSSAQKVSLNIHGENLRTVLENISKQTGYSLAYSKEVINLNEEVTIQANQEELTKVLDQLLTPRNLGYEIRDDKIYILYRAPKRSDSETTVLTQQNQPSRQQLRGIVTDVSGEPIIGVNITVLGTSIGVTDIDGHYSLEVPKGAELRFTYIGYIDQVITIENQTTLDIILREDTELLEEVVVVGYGTQRKETLSGSIASISANDITTTKTENLINNIQGKVPGLLIRQQSGEPGTFNNAISIRGYGEPMIVIDGIVRNGTADLA